MHAFFFVHTAVECLVQSVLSQHVVCEIQHVVREIFCRKWYGQCVDHFIYFFSYTWCADVSFTCPMECCCGRSTVSPHRDAEKSTHPADSSLSPNTCPPFPRCRVCVYMCARVRLQEMSMGKLREMEGRTHEDPLREVAALQYLSRDGHPNILTCTEVRKYLLFYPHFLCSLHGPHS